MSLVLIVYLIGVIPSIAVGLNVVAVLGTIILGALATGLKIDSNSTTCYSWDDQKLLKERRVRNGVLGDKCIKAAIFTLVLGLLSGLFPTKETMYVMLGAYGVQLASSNPDVQRLAKQSLSTIESLLKDYEEGLNKNDKQ